MFSLFKNIILPGFKKIPLGEIIPPFYKGIKEGALTFRASSVSFNFFLALFPTIIFFFTIIPYIPIHHFPDLLMESLKNLMPENAFKTIQSTIDDILRRPRGGLLSVGFILALYFSTNGINSIIEGFNTSTHTQETRSWFKQRVVCMVLVLILTLLVISSIALISLNTTVLKFLMREGILKSYFSYYMILFGKWVILLALIYFTNSFIYYLGPAKSEQYRFFSPGSTLVTFLILVTTIGFNFYINNFSKYNALYGSIGTLLIILMWIYLNAIITLIGYELNAVIHDTEPNKVESKK